MARSRNIVRPLYRRPPLRHRPTRSTASARGSAGSARPTRQPRCRSRPIPRCSVGRQVAPSRSEGERRRWLAVNDIRRRLRQLGMRIGHQAEQAKGRKCDPQPDQCRPSRRAALGQRPHCRKHCFRNANTSSSHVATLRSTTLCPSDAVVPKEGYTTLRWALPSLAISAASSRPGATE